MIFKSPTDSEHISFCEDENKIKHLLKASRDALKWTRSVEAGDDSFSTDMSFAGGKTERMDYVTPHGMIPMDIATRKYELSRQENGLPHIQLEYVLEQDGKPVSEYKADIRVKR